ncbi:ubiquinone biosynthesis O-methyltransferase, mitochondrial isoform X2 [Hyalella azteca]|uniref:Ubiquinone biosynthesis O-methyltransferase, mitochondrial n=1 Tax=Hyalella azteca TaxID=294128 RepID=A0A979FU42_HYAAZ|nr:ubiquinone biosynthesis O-methyltransferase, mitochondrial isoform X2 [Hyalella azteca]
MKSCRCCLKSLLCHQSTPAWWHVMPQNYCTVREINIKTETYQNTRHKQQSSFNDEEVRKFGALSDHWWARDGPYKPLHSLNRLRVPLVRDGLISTGATVSKDGRQPLEGVTILDVGCGGGILSEPLARLGASVTGLDASHKSIEAAQQHSSLDADLQGRLQYKCCDLDTFSQRLDQQYDAVVASEVLEHVDSIEAFIESCNACLKPSGSLFLTTINRTPLSFLGAIVAAEYLLRIVPVGTHTWDKFVPIEALKKLLEERGLQTRLQHGMLYAPVLDRWCWVADTSVNYALHAVNIADTSVNYALHAVNYAPESPMSPESPTSSLS